MKKVYSIKNIYVFAIAIFCVMALLCGACVYITRSTQCKLTVDRNNEVDDVFMPLSGVPFMLEVAPGMKFKFDSGADCSVLNRKDAEKLRQMGYDVREEFGPIAGRDGFGDYIFSAKRYVVSLPVGGYEVEQDSLGSSRLVYKGSPAAMLRNVDFLPSDDVISTIGLDIMSKFKTECIYRLGAVVLHDSLPSGYQKVVDIEKNIHLTDFLWSDTRPYVIVSVNQSANLYLIDTGLQRVAIKKPWSESRMAKHTLRRDSIHTMHHVYEAFVDDEAWVDCGTRSGTKSVYYYQNPEDDYQINPLNVFQQDMVIDLAGSGIYFRPTAMCCRTR